MKRLFLAFMILCILLLSSLSFAARKKALLVGIADYEHLDPCIEDICDLKGPIGDVNLIENALTLYGFSDIRVLKNGGATRRTIIDGIRWLAGSDHAVVYFAGHAGQVNDAEDGEGGCDEVLLTHDFTQSDPFTYIGDDELWDLLRALSESRRVVVIMDSCFSAGLLRENPSQWRIKGDFYRTLEDTPTRKGRGGYRFNNCKPGRPDVVPPGVILMAASGEDQRAQEHRYGDGFYGVFSFALYQALMSLQNPTYNELFEETRRRMGNSGFAQTPQLIIGADADGKETAFGGREPASASDSFPHLELGQEPVLVALEGNWEGTTPEEMERFRGELTRIPHLKRVEPDTYFDRLIRGQKSGEYYTVRILNRLGDWEQIKSVTTIPELVEQTETSFEYAYFSKQLAGIHHPTPPFRIKLWVQDKENHLRWDFSIDKDKEFNIYIESEQDGSILMIHLNNQGKFTIFPHSIKGGDTSLPFPSITLALPTGEETLKVIATAEPLDLEELDLWKLCEETQTMEEKTQILQKLIDTLSSSEFAWSDDTALIRIYE